MSLSTIFSWLLERTRPELHYATMVVAYGVAFFTITFVLLVLIPTLFGIENRIRYEFLAYLVATAGPGALVAGYLRHHLPSGPFRPWVVAATFGGVAGAMLGGLANLKHGGSIPIGLLVGALSGTAFGVALLWAVLREHRNGIDGAA